MDFDSLILFLFALYSLIIPILIKQKKLNLKWIFPLIIIPFISSNYWTSNDLFVFKDIFLIYPISICLILLICFCLKDIDKDLETKISLRLSVFSILGQCFILIFFFLFFNKVISIIAYPLASEKIGEEIEIVKFDAMRMKNHFGRYVVIKKDNNIDKIFLWDLQKLNSENYRIFDELEYNNKSKFKIYGRKNILGLAVDSISNVSIEKNN